MDMNLFDDSNDISKIEVDKVKREELKKNGIIDYSGDSNIEYDMNFEDVLRIKNDGSDAEPEPEPESKSYKPDEETMSLEKFYLKKFIDELKLIDDEVSDEEEEADRQEYNFRYQEDVGNRVLGQKPNSREVRKAERMAIAESELKHLKKKEYLDKVKKVAGISDESGGFVLEEEDLEEEFDPEKHDRKMQQMFNYDYYNSLDAKPDFSSDDDDEEDEDLKKPDFAKKEDVDKDQEMARQGKKKKRKRKPSHLEKVALDDELDQNKKKELKEELYKLDYEDYHRRLDVDDKVPHFPYRRVKPKRYGLSVRDILLMDDGELNQYVSLKKIAPYVENEYKVPRVKRYEQKMKNKELFEGGKVHKKKSFKDQVQASFSGNKDSLEKEEEKVQGENVSRQSKRRRQQQELKLSNSRKTAYGTVDAPKSKRKSKHNRT